MKKQVDASSYTTSWDTTGGSEVKIGRFIERRNENRGENFHSMQWVPEHLLSPDVARVRSRKNRLNGDFRSFASGFLSSFLYGHPKEAGGARREA